MKHTFRYLVAGRPTHGDVVRLAPSDAHHLARVVRRTPGDPVEIVDAAGLIWPAVVESTEDEVTVRVLPGPRPGPAPAPVVLFQGLAEWNRIDTVVEKCAELGIPRIVMMTTDRARRVPEPDAWRRRRERMLRVAEAAARQSGQGHLPRVEGLLTLDAALERGRDTELVMLDPSGERPLDDVLRSRPPSVVPLGLMVGPDAGFSRAEVDRARTAGVTVCTVGAGILRAETAALVAVTLALAAGGHLARFPLTPPPTPE